MQEWGGGGYCGSIAPCESVYGSIQRILPLDTHNCHVRDRKEIVMEGWPASTLEAESGIYMPMRHPIKKERRDLQKTRLPYRQARPLTWK